MRRRVIVSIDGGGIRGIIPLILLKEIQQRLSKDLFSLDISWWGTSTGALITGALNIQQQLSFGIAVQNVLDMYEFRSAASINPPNVGVPSRALGQMIQSNFGDINLTQFPELNIVVSEEESLNPIVFNHRNACKIADAIAASCAFPGVFPPVKINDQFYVDGFFKAKNPALIATKFSLKEMEQPLVLSLGTGKLRAYDAIEESVFQVDREMEEMSKGNKLDYFRFNPELVHAVDDMQNASSKNIFNLRKDALSFIIENETKIAALVDHLKKA